MPICDSTHIAYIHIQLCDAAQIEGHLIALKLFYWPNFIR